MQIQTVDDTQIHLANEAVRRGNGNDDHITVYAVGVATGTGSCMVIKFPLAMLALMFLITSCASHPVCPTTCRKPVNQINYEPKFGIKLV